MKAEVWGVLLLFGSRWFVVLRPLEQQVLHLVLPPNLIPW